MSCWKALLHKADTLKSSEQHFINVGTGVQNQISQYVWSNTHWYWYCNNIVGMTIDTFTDTNTMRFVMNNYQVVKGKYVCK